MATGTVKLPYEFEPRSYQMPLWRAFDNGFKRGIQCWHRRAGKDLNDLNLLTKKAIDRVGSYYYYFPTFAMGRKIIWEGADKSGRRFLSYIPQEIIKGKPNNQEMKLEFVNDSIMRIIGTDRNEPVGTNPVGCVFSEYSLQDPRAWNYVRPILRENGGWALFNFTPRGRNHAWRLYDRNRNNPKWFVQLLTIDDTGVLCEADIQEDRDEGMSEELVQQEYCCSFDYGMEGAYYARWMGQLRKQGRICEVTYDPAVPVHTFWDLGVGDSTAIWFVQFIRNEIHLLEYFEASGEGFGFYLKELQKRPYVYGNHYVPHDAQAREKQTGVSLVTYAKKLGIRLAPQSATVIEYGIECARSLLPLCWFEVKKTEFGVDCLVQYQREKNERMSTEYRPVYKDHPLHDWSSHGADAFRLMAVVYRQQFNKANPFKIHGVTDKASRRDQGVTNLLGV